MNKPEEDARKKGGTPAEGTEKGVAVTRADVILVALFFMAGAAGSFLVDRAVSWVGRGLEPREARTRLAYDLQWKQDALAMTRKEQAATEDRLIKARLELYDERATLAALEAAPSSEEARAESRLKLDSAARRTDRLVKNLDDLQQTANALRREIEDGGRRAALDFGFWHVVFKALRAASVFALTLLLVWGVYRLLRRLLARYSARAEAGGVRVGDGGFLLKAVAGVLAVLVAYQTFELAGAALAAAVVLLLFLTKAPRPAKPEAAGGK